MSHSTVLVVLTDAAVAEHGVDGALAAALEPFDENKDTEQYISNTKAELIQGQRESYIRARDEGPYAEYLKDKAAFLTKNYSRQDHLRYVTEEFPHEILPKLDDDAFMFAKATDWGMDLDADGNELSTYNPKSYRLRRVTTNLDTEGLVLSDHGKREEADQSARQEVLFEVRDDEGLGGIPSGDTVPRRSVHVLHTLHKGAERGTDTAAAAGLVDPEQVQDGAGGVRRPAGQAGGSVRHLQAAADGEHEVDGAAPTVGGSLPFDGSSEGVTVLQLQHGTRFVSGFRVIANSGDDLPAAPDGWTWGSEVSGAKWDWYTVGGRWTGRVLNWTDTVHHPAQEKPYKQEAWDEKVGGEDIARKRDLDQFAGTFAFLSAAGEWHERGRMGWFGMVSDEQPQDDWDQRQKQLVEDVAEDDWLVVVDVHI